MPARIRKNDLVQVMVGKDRGKRGKVIRVFPKNGMVVVEGVNIVKRHKKKRHQKDEGGIIEKTMPLAVCKVMFVDTKLDQPTRVGFLVDGSKAIRVSKKSGEEVV